MPLDEAGSPVELVAQWRRALVREIAERDAERARSVALLHDPVTPMQGGRVWADGTIDGGATISFTLGDS